MTQWSRWLQNFAPRLASVNRRRRLTLEACEARLAPAVATLSAGVLTIDYTATGTTAESVTITRSSSLIVLTGNVSGATSNAAASVTKIAIQDSGGGTNQTLGSDVSTSLSGGLSCIGVETVSLANTTVTGTGTIAVSSANKVGVYSLSTVSGAITLDASATLTANNTKTTGGGAITFNSAGTIQTVGTIQTSSDAPITLNAVGAITQTSGGIRTTGVLTLQMGSGQTATFNSGTNRVGQMVVPFGNTVIVNGAFDFSSAVQVDGTLAGNGTLGTVTVTNTGKVSPGNSPGKLATGNIAFNSGSVFTVEMNGITAATDLDQMVVLGNINLGNATLQGNLGFAAGSGYALKIIDNQGSEPVNGTFNGLPEGATVNLGGIDLTISYQGGDGNDVTLTAPGTPISLPKVTGVTFGDGTGQRSMVKQVVVNFSEPVSFTGSVASAFTLRRTGVNLINGNPIGNVMLLATPAAGPASSVTITFDAADTTFVENGSLIDGNYDFTIDATQVSGTNGALDGDGNNSPGGNFSVIGAPGTKFFRLFGDINGDGHVNQPDYDAFRMAYQAGPSSIFDFGGDGQVSQTDFNNFRLRYLVG